jgi:hypothetical protein
MPFVTRGKCAAKNVISVLYLTTMKTVLCSERVIIVNPLCGGKEIVTKLCNLDSLSPEPTDGLCVRHPINGIENVRHPMITFRKVVLVWRNRECLADPIFHLRAYDFPERCSWTWFDGSLGMKGLFPGYMHW